MDEATVKRLVKQQSDVMIETNIVTRGRRKTVWATVISAVFEDNAWKLKVEDGHGRISEVWDKDILDHY